LVYGIGVVNGVMVAATSDGMYYADENSEVPYGEWTRGSHVDIASRVDLPLLGPASAMASQNGLAYAGIGNEVYRSNDGKVWLRIYQFTGSEHIADPNALQDAERKNASLTYINKILMFENKVYLATGQGLYNDNGSARSDQVAFDLELVGGPSVLNAFPINDVFGVALGSSSSMLLAVGESPYVYNWQGTWTQSLVAGVQAINKVAETPAGVQVVFSGNSVYFG